MQNRKQKTVWNTFTIVSLGLLAAMQIVLSRFFAINVGGFGRFTLGPVAVIMAGLWFGPAGGALTGITADLLGCLIQGYMVNPLITMAAAAWGIIPALFRPESGQPKKKQILLLAGGVLLSGVVSSLILNTMGLVLILGYNFYAIMPTRLLQFTVMIPTYIVLTVLLYFSQITSFVRQSIQIREKRN